MPNNEAQWVFECGACGTHDSFWKTVVTSPQWKLWEKEMHKRLCSDGRPECFDVDESRECGWISQKHFQAFLNFLLESEEKKRASSISGNAYGGK